MNAFRVAVLAGMLTIAACSSKVTPENYDKIGPGMSRAEVHAILGKPDDVNAEDIGGLLSLSKERWHAGKKVLTVTYGNDSVALKSFETEPNKSK